MGWKDFVNCEHEEILRIRTYSPFELEAKIAILMDEAQQYEICLEVGAIIDSFFNLYMFANEQKLTDDELILLLKLQSKLLEDCEAGFTIHDSIKNFSVAFKEPSSEDQKSFHNLPCSTAVIDYMFLTFYQHYELYHHIFHYSQTIEELDHKISLDVVPVAQAYPHPLEEGISEEWYNLYLNPTTEVQEENVNEGEEVVSVSTPTPDEEVSTEGDTENKVESLLASINADEMKKVIKEIAERRLNSVKVELESKILEKETTLLKNIEKLKL